MHGNPHHSWLQEQQKKKKTHQFQKPNSSFLGKIAEEKQKCLVEIKNPTSKNDPTERSPSLSPTALPARTTQNPSILPPPFQRTNHQHRSPTHHSLLKPSSQNSHPKQHITHRLPFRLQISDQTLYQKSSMLAAEVWASRVHSRTTCQQLQQRS